ncbi:monothiol glutaredoxin [Microstroma glucosiphilum]|uniref:Monothiol glutaredoxin-5, mitochondrial n=1 Tax=Pseudomicrostroma glucosiphilum TaxID=1684307 RepID=A0A316UGT1_9BASI|nr:monothiol glutaredoxin [Pseudomicrostroma glucosiphilum]PWN24134.1 monothiol glutaredoxin [Pseudomicrostroma glucosiphilum]
MSLFRQASSSLRLLRTPATSSSLLQAPAQRSLFHTTSLRLALSADARKKIDAAVQGNPLVVFMKGTPELPMCGFSRAVCQIMEVQGVKPEVMKTYNCLDDPELREGVKEYSSWPTIPQVYVNGEFVGGCDIMLSMHQSGELEQVLEKAGVLSPLPPPSEAPKA